MRRAGQMPLCQQLGGSDCGLCVRRLTRPRVEPYTMFMSPSTHSSGPIDRWAHMFTLSGCVP